MNDAYLAIGSNLDPSENIRRAIPAILRRLQVTGASRFFRNRAYTPEPGAPPSPDFINGALRVRTSLDPLRLKLDVLRPIERRAGRRRTADRYAPRALDLDILLYGDLKLDTRDLKLPDPELTVRPFLAVPLADLVPDLVLPGTKLPLRDLATRMDTSGWVIEQELTRSIWGLLGLAGSLRPGARRPDAGP